MNRFHILLDKLHLRLMSLLAISLDLAPDFFQPQIDGRNHCLRLLHYPPVPRSGSSNRIGAHTDFGTTTILVSCSASSSSLPTLSELCRHDEADVLALLLRSFRMTLAASRSRHRAGPLSLSCPSRERSSSTCASLSPSPRFPSLLLTSPPSLTLDLAAATSSRGGPTTRSSRWCTEPSCPICETATTPTASPRRGGASPTSVTCVLFSLLVTLALAFDERKLTLLRRSHPSPSHAAARDEQPNPDAVISCIPGLEGPSGKAKYAPVVAGDYYAAMLEAEIGA